MPLTNPSELRVFLASLGVKPKKGLSQNFLIDGNIIRKIIAEADVRPGDSILEIGPGPGALTEALYASKAKLIAVERDRVYAEALSRFKGIDVYSADILDFDLTLLPPNTKVVSNLPYHLTAPILTRLAPQYPQISTITVMVQEEVARRIVAQPKTKEYGSLSVFLRFYADAHYAFKVSRNCFYPRPKVDSAVITLSLKKPPQTIQETFFWLIRTAFGQRRKMLKTTLKNPQIGDVLERLGENPNARPEELSIEIFLELVKFLD